MMDMISSVQNPKCRPFILAGCEWISQLMDCDNPPYMYYPCSG